MTKRFDIAQQSKRGWHRLKKAAAVLLWSLCVVGSCIGLASAEVTKEDAERYYQYLKQAQTISGVNYGTADFQIDGKSNVIFNIGRVLSDGGSWSENADKGRKKDVIDQVMDSAAFKAYADVMAQKEFIDNYDKYAHNSDSAIKASVEKIKKQQKEALSKTVEEFMNNNLKEGAKLNEAGVKTMQNLFDRLGGTTDEVAVKQKQLVKEKGGTPCGTAMTMCKEDEKCISCKGNDGLATSNINKTTYLCVPKTQVQSGCKDAPEGGYNETKTHSFTTSSADPDAEKEQCVTVAELKARYQSGCWSCLVVEKLTSSFLKAASKAYGLSQRAGLIVLGIGSILWLLIWGLKNMSSLSQLQPGNIVNELVRFFFKVLLAYLFIVAGLSVVKNYFITPIMGTGAVFAQQFWDDSDLGYGSLEDGTENFSWEEEIDTGGLTQEEAKKVVEQYKENIKIDEKNRQEVYKDIPKAGPMTAEEQQKLKKAAEEVKKRGVPDFIIYPVQGRLTSKYGKRAAAGCAKHKGIDIGAGRPMKRDPVTTCEQPIADIPIVAAYDGTTAQVGWQKPHIRCGKDAGYGLRLYIIHAGGWRTVYGHVKKFAVKEGQYVKKGQTIAYIGNSGHSTGPHLHFEIQLNGTAYDPEGLADGEINAIDLIGTRGECGDKLKSDTPTQVGPGFTPVPGDYEFVTGGGSSSSGSGGSGGGSISESGVYGSSDLTVKIGEVTYTGPNDIMPKSVMNSILAATRIITNNTAENMVLGHAIQCYASLPQGGAWKIKSGWWKTFYITNALMWLQGVLIWCAGFLLTIAIAYYLIDMSFKLGFAVIALPICVGLWPFKMTSSKFSACLSIIFKSAAIFAFLAITSSYAMKLISEAVGGPDGDGLKRLYDAVDAAVLGVNNDANMDYVSERLAIFSFDFIIMMFAFIYSFKLIGATVTQYVNSFFPDKMLGGSQPMHQWATAASRAVKDIAMKPVDLVRDIALHQTGRAVTGAVSGAVGMVSRGINKGKKGDKEESGGEGDDKKSEAKDDKKDDSGKK